LRRESDEVGDRDRTRRRRLFGRGLRRGYVRWRYGRGRGPIAVEAETVHGKRDARRDCRGKQENQYPIARFHPRIIARAHFFWAATGTSVCAVWEGRIYSNERRVCAERSPRAPRHGSDFLRTARALH